MEHRPPAHTSHDPFLPALAPAPLPQAQISIEDRAWRCPISGSTCFVRGCSDSAASRATQAPSPIYAGLKYIVVAYIISLAFWLQLAGAGHGVSMPPRRV